ncbi:DNA phosphorothioation-dependent restriction protein DptF [Moritella sp. 36]|uniref:DNA phosphorothioation-dependent restriction protein DptF n=1 Tax=Moritella sp. 36 TaxID=2746233 RepID=UPI0021036025|nr:DNA phosphorothioation-dependent restriction protein DptF [Moritella sp. 36]
MTESLSFRQALSVLSKSSPYAVSTERDSGIHPDLDLVKKYLLVGTDINDHFDSLLTSISSADKKLIFLCGSSGDGKSEILTQAKKKHNSKATFYFDATHSLRPDATAIQTLDELFETFVQGSQSLVVGINTGMLGNYANEGKVDSIKASINGFLSDKISTENHIFVDFEHFPKFQLNTDGHTSDFVLKVFKKITASEDNLIRQYYDIERALDNPNKRLCANYRLLAMPSVQLIIVDLLFKARLERDQFLTARALLDFIYHLLVGGEYLFENLFSGSDCDLIKKMADFDPVNMRNKAIDNFVLTHRFKGEKSEFDIFSKELRDFGINVKSTTSAQTYIRIFYLLKDEPFGNNYHKQFSHDFNDDILNEYSKCWRLHWSYSESHKKDIKEFYNQVLLKGLLTYNNRSAAGLGNREFLVRHLNGYNLVAELDIKYNPAAIKQQSCIHETNNHFDDVSHFYAHIKVNGKDVNPIRININLLSLLNRIVKGYRPNKHDKNTILLLDEIINELRTLANAENTLYIHHIDKEDRKDKKYRVEDVDCDGSELEVSGG